jgi:hypothetical protein
VRVWYLVIATVAALYLVLAGLIAMPTPGEQTDTATRHTEYTPPSTRDLPPANGPAYNYRHMAMGAAIVAAMLATTVWVVRRQGRSPARTQ